MIESIARFILSMAMPLNLTLILFTAAGILLLIRWYRASAGTAITAVVILLISVTPVIPNLFIANLEGRHPVLQDPAELVWNMALDLASNKIGEQQGDPELPLNSAPDIADISTGPAVADTIIDPEVADTTVGLEIHILVLGGGHSPDPWLPATNRLSPRALSRLTEGIRLHRMLPESRLILSGWSSSGSASVAEVMVRAAIDLGVDSTRISMITEPSNTCREARFYYREFGRDNPLILVTTASHMPRAVQLFRQNGLDPVPAPTGHRIKFHPDRRYFYMKTDASNVDKLETAIKEYLGMIWGRYNCR